VTVEDYERTDEQNVMLAINEMLTEEVETPDGIRYASPV
jgi:hypothetical protein